MLTEFPDVVRFGRSICGDLEEAERREWWLANGRGAYAAGTIAGTLTRRYHGLLIAPVAPPLGRHMVVVKADATLQDGELEIPLFTNRWARGAVDPRGHAHIESFHLEGKLPVCRYALGEHAIEMRIWMEPGAHTTYVTWCLIETGAPERPLQLRVRLLANARDHHGVSDRAAFQPAIEVDDSPVGIRVCNEGGYGHPYTLHLRVRGGTIAPARVWMENFDLPVERERGLPDTDHHLCVAEAQLNLRPGVQVGIVASLESDCSSYLDEALRRHQARDLGLLRRARVRVPELLDAPPWVQQLVLAADTFIFARPLPEDPDGESIIAGYPWFGDWGRDTMIALPGLTLATGRYESAQRILRTFARFVDRGMLPNVFPGAGATAEYNTVDAALWYIEAWRAYVEATGDWRSLAECFDTLHGIIEWHVNGTRYGIGVDPADGLLRAGEPGVQLTWMDAKIGDWVVTPRIGKPVEVNALWFNALAAMVTLGESSGRPTELYREWLERACRGFRRFLNPESGHLFDVLDGPDGNDPTLRPNQIFTVSLPASPLEPAEQAGVVAWCARELACSYGLRSLDPAHPHYRGRYEGGVWERDGAYHQGPLWGFLLGHFAIAEHRVQGDPQRALRRLEPVRDHLLDAGLGTVSEIFDGAPPHLPRGAPAQAWSVACLLEAWWRLERARRASKASTESIASTADSQTMEDGRLAARG